MKPAQLKSGLLWLLALGMIFAGIMHFRDSDAYASIVPSYLPVHRLLVQISGVCEILLGVGLLAPALRRFSAWGLIALFIAVFPANVNMAVHDMAIGGRHYPLLLWLRLPVQVLLIAWAGRFTRLESDTARK